MGFDLNVVQAEILDPQDGEQRIRIRAEVMARTSQQHEHISKILNADSRVTATKCGKGPNGMDFIEITVYADDDEINPKAAIAVPDPDAPATTTQAEAPIPSAEDLDTVMNELKNAELTSGRAQGSDSPAPNPGSAEEHSIEHGGEAGGA